MVDWCEECVAVYTQPVKVAIGIIFNKNLEILITKRPKNAPQGKDLWEFPGGKLKPNETPSEALIREVKEEVDLDVLSFEPFDEISVQGSEACISLFFFCVTQYKGVAIRRESQQDLRWIKRSDLGKIKFPEANRPIIKRLSQLANC